MTAPTSFGRRQPALASSQASWTPPVQPVTRPAPPSSGIELSPEAEAFRVQLATEPDAGSDGFAAWRQAQSPQRLMEWAVTLTFLSPGVLCFVIGAPKSLAGLLEIVGIAAGVWVRARRRRRLSEITAWEAPQPQG